MRDVFSNLYSTTNSYNKSSKIQEPQEEKKSKFKNNFNLLLLQANLGFKFHTSNSQKI